MSKLEISEDEIRLSLERRFKSKDFKLLKWNVISFNEEGKLGYLGDHFRLETTVQRGDEEEEVSFFAKTTPATKTQLDLVKKGSLFLKEYLFYKLLADKMIAVLSKASPFVADSKVSVIPRCYLARDDMILMEDLHSFNFEGKDASTPLTLDFFKLSMRALARYHAASIAWEEEVGKPLLDGFPELNFETFLDGSPDHCLATWHAASLHAAKELISKLEKYKDKPEIVKKAQAAMPDFVADLMRAVHAWPDTKNVFCHGDLWINNILFRLDDAGKPLEAVLVDYQLLRYAPPATDILIFLLFSSDKQFRDKNTDAVLRAYYDELSKTLLELDIQPDKVLPWEELLRTMKDLQKHALVLMTMEYPLALAPSEWMDPILKDGQKYYQHFLVNRTPFCIKMFEENEKFRTRYTEVVEELIDNYVVDK